MLQRYKNAAIQMSKRGGVWLRETKCCISLGGRLQLNFNNDIQFPGTSMYICIISMFILCILFAASHGFEQQ